MRSFWLIAATAATVFASRHNAPVYSKREDNEPLPELFERATFSEPCAEASASWAALLPKSTSGNVWIKSEVAYECLQSVPVDTEGDLKQIEELKNFVALQSTTSYLKEDKFKLENNPVIDVVGTLDGIAAGVKNGSYSSEYEVQQDISVLFLRAGDFHFEWRSDILQPFYFVRDGAQIVQLANDSTSFGEVYVFGDVQKVAANQSFTMSPIVTINGKNATEYLYNVSFNVAFHTDDARFNNLFVNQNLWAIGAAADGPFVNPQIYDGPETVFQFANGSNATFDNLAMIPSSHPFTNVTDGPSFFNKFCQGPGFLPTRTNDKRAASSTPASLLPFRTATGYPKPVIVQSSLQFQGYFLDDNDYSDVAVLVTPGFHATIGPGTNETNQYIESQKMLWSFFASCRNAGKKKLVIDLRGNQGGFVDLGFELFKQLFPSIEPYGASRYRASEAFQVFSEALADVVGNSNSIPRVNYTNYTSFVLDVGPVAYQGVLNEQNQPFKSFNEYIGPYTHNNDNFTAVRRYNFSNNVNGHFTAQSFNLTGYKSNSQAPPQPFEASNIVILTDGFCGSTCSVFYELMRTQGHVQSIGVGGVPRPGPMQAVGGTKGSNVLSYDIWMLWFNQVLSWITLTRGESVARRMRATAFGAILNTTQLYLRTSHSSSGSPVLSGRVNSLDGLRQNGAEQVPLEFIYDAVDCRIFETYQMRLDVKNLWKLVVDTKWGSGKCLEGSTNNPNAISVVTNQAFNSQYPLPKANTTTDSPPPAGSTGSKKGAAPSLSMSRSLVGAAVALSAALLVF